MALLRVVRHRSLRLIPVRPAAGARAPGSTRRATGLLVALGLLGLAMSACEAPDTRYLPDDVLRRELGLDDDDLVHTILLTGGARERAEPALDTVPVGAWVQFVSDDWLVHEVSFEQDSLAAPVWDFLVGTDQVRSPPLLQRDARFVISLAGAPPGRYPYRLDGNAASGGGTLIVVAPDAR